MNWICDVVTSEPPRHIIRADDDDYEYGAATICATAHPGGCNGVCDKSSDHKGKTRHRCGHCKAFWD
jgi:hypothetical protein